MLKTFKIGGVHPPENKLSAQGEIITLPLPEQVIIPLSQHIGAPAVPTVKKGDTVKVGQLIGQAAGFISANIHSSVSGTVTSIDPVVDASGYPRPAITIKVEGDEWDENILKEPIAKHPNTFTKEEIIAAISAAGIVGMGGATFPTQVKLSPPPGNTAEVLIINGVECEPYLTADHRLMLEHGKELIAGIELLMKALNVKRAIVGIENNKKDAIEELGKHARLSDGIEICPLKIQYPQGGEKQLIQATTGKFVPSGGLPIAVGAVVQNVGTVYAVYEAVMKHKPLFERVVTVTGKSLKEPGNYLCRIGTPLSQLIEAAGGLPEDTGKVIGGGPMMGKALTTTNIAITKGTSGVLLMRQEESVRKEYRNCIRCSKCVTVCPMGLEPYYLMQLSEHNKLDALEAEKIMDCIECGSCSYTCPANRPLLDVIRLGKARTGQMIRSRKN
ncbi:MULTISPECIES: electron transport complex subunit RsxC [Butyricimonas]|uniref:electron transport complex subunit RsxC n=1 Tax=Butyricimonas TaxID=574697 RepID=UPI001D08F66A|nr:MULTISPECIES: electron transport complex subunit RsxC [Butyricimonas]MCB6971755.1 electron transport complex subunit RsxC [Butyricimonas synergistica]MCG4518638.1 electron transport complex subunit RsxC [Butyricimonas sp. DFI.6.44]